MRAAPALALSLALLSGTAVAMEGTVVDRQGKPIAGARACWVSGKVELLCSQTDETGYFSLPDSEQDSLRIVADEYLPREVPGTAVVAPIVLELAPSLWVHLLDGASGKPLAEGEVSVVYSSGHAQGPFPVNASGVRVRRVLKPGEVRIVATVPGYVQDAPLPTELESGKETEVTLELRPAAED